MRSILLVESLESVAQTYQGDGLDRVEQLARLLGREHGGLAAPDHVLGAAHGTKDNRPEGQG
jgi:hypothetical protein